MTASYWVLASEELIRDMDPSLLPDGMRLTGQVRGVAEPAEEGSAWVQIEDENAPEELDGRRVELVLARRGREGARAVVSYLRALP